MVAARIKGFRIYSTHFDHTAPQDRIDFVLYKGSTLKAVGSRTVGGGRDRPLDHLAVLTTFTC
ncbi:hypothetical protein C6N75_01410 [Streptomyces solincola]|uniref:Endonuclease/exonuclease/phosphatase domain-containing protein n=1 Tax=Streptomyces solincola TaxID=2100817 RepID=A0A2S9Q2X5_9ACTN|nr:hypothetical protein C6N75_01410 [Streptomyces solincola]